jgi:Asp-tRNA(Asn)/Glu-tRNA(Gln) amidotransferase C subunit
MTNIDKIRIEKQAKEILDKFAKALEKVEKEGKEHTESYVERDEFEREERGISSSDKSNENCKFAAEVVTNFKERILENSPNHDNDFIIAEKGAWK